MPPMLPRPMALHDTGDDNTATVAPELTSQITPNWTICTRQPLSAGSAGGAQK